MPRIPQPPGNRGSLKWIQLLVNEHPEVLSTQLRQTLRLPSSTGITWVSPLRDDEYAEYRDQAFLDCVGLEPSQRALKDFWPARGPQWDALARLSDGGAILAEAKAHVDEILSPPMQASEPSHARIVAALEEARDHFGAATGCDWSLRFYQYANRLAHLYLLREVNGLDVYLAFVYFLNDPDLNGPHTRREWEAAIAVLHEALGLHGKLSPRHVAAVFVDERALER